MFKKALCYIAGLVLGIGLVISFTARAETSPAAGNLPLQQIRSFAEVYGQVKANYYQDTDDKKLMEDAMKGMVGGLDPHSEYLNQDNFKSLMEQTSGKFGGLGLEIFKDETTDFVKIITPIEDTPAFRAGLKPNDFIIKINGKTTKGMSTMEASKLMRGNPGTAVVLTISRKNELTPFDVKIKRDTINIKSVKSKTLQPGIGYVRISGFQEKTVEDFVKHIQNLYQANNGHLNGLILDLRNNGGGLLNSAVGISAVFLPAGSVVVSTKGKYDVPQSILKAVPKDYINPGGGFFAADPLLNLPAAVKNVPLTVLINSGSASASEIVTGALQDDKKAVIVGTQSFGKGSVQTIIPLSSRDGLKLTVALYYTPADRSIQARGIVPDVIVKTDEDDFYQIREADFNNHLSNPTGGTEVKTQTKGINPDTLSKEEKAATKKKLKDKFLREAAYNYMPDPATDIQLKKALEIAANPALWQKSAGLYKANERVIIKEEAKTKKDTDK